MEIEKAVEEAVQAKSEGVKTIKLKGGVDQKRDVELVKQILEGDWPGVEYLRRRQPRLSQRKNRRVKITKAMEEFNLLYMEQPVEGLDQMAEVARRVDTPIMADESAWTPQDVIEIVQKKAADVILHLYHQTRRPVQSEESRRGRGSRRAQMQRQRLG